MNYILKSRGMGKTYDLIMKSHKTGYRILCPNLDMAKFIKDMAKNMKVDIPEPKTYSYVQLHGATEDKYLIDELRMFIEYNLGINVDTVTDTPDDIIINQCNQNRNDYLNSITTKKDSSKDKVPKLKNFNVLVHTGESTFETKELLANDICRKTFNNIEELNKFVEKYPSCHYIICDKYIDNSIEVVFALYNHKMSDGSICQSYNLNPIDDNIYNNSTVKHKKEYVIDKLKDTIKLLEDYKNILK